MKIKKLNESGQARSSRFNTYKNRIEKAIEKCDAETLKRTKEAIMYAPAKELKNSEAKELMDMIKGAKLEEALTGYKITVVKDGETFDDYACAYEEAGAIQQMKNKYGDNIEVKGVAVSKVIKESKSIKTFGAKGKKLNEDARLKLDLATKRQLLQKARTVCNFTIGDNWFEIKNNHVLLNILLANDADDYEKVMDRAAKIFLADNYNDVWMDDYVLVVDVTEWFKDNEFNPSSIEDYKDAIDVAYTSGGITKSIEEFVLSHGVDANSDSYFDGLSDEDVRALYNLCKELLTARAKSDDLDTRLYSLFNITDNSLTESFILDDDEFERIDRSGTDDERLLAAVSYMYGVDMNTAKEYIPDLGDTQRKKALAYYDLRDLPRDVRLSKIKELYPRVRESFEGGYKKGDKVELPNGQTGTIYRDVDYSVDDRAAVEIDGMDEIKYPLIDTLRSIRESADATVKRWQVEYFIDENDDADTPLQTYVYTDSKQEAVAKVKAEYPNAQIVYCVSEEVPASYKDWDLKESIEVATIADYISDHYEFDDIDDKYGCINSIRDSFKDEKTISWEELEQFIGAHNGRDKGLEESLSNLKDMKVWTRKITKAMYDLVQSGALGDNVKSTYTDIEIRKVSNEDMIMGIFRLKGARALDVISQCKETPEVKELLDNCPYDVYMTDNEHVLYGTTIGLDTVKIYVSDKDNQSSMELEESATHCVYFTQDGIDQVEFEGTEDECNKYIKDIQAEQDDEFGDEAPERFIRRINEEADIQYGVHQFSTDSIIFRGTEEECGKYIDNNKKLWDDAEVYRMTPDDPHYKKDLDEASYGGAFDIADDQYFTKDDLMSFADEVLGHVAETFNGVYDIGGVWFEDGNVITQIVDDSGNEYEDTTKVDMRKIREPWHLKRMYAFPVAANIIQRIKDTDGDVITENIRGMGEYSDKFHDYLNFLMDEGKQDNIAYLASQLIRYCKEEDLKDLWLDRMSKTAEMVGFEASSNDLDEGLMDEFHKAQRWLDFEIPDACKATADKLPDMTEQDMAAINKHSMKFKDVLEYYSTKASRSNESLTESATDAEPIETGAAVGMAAVVSDLIKDEYEAIEGYNSAIATAQAEGYDDAVRVLTEIQAEENIHVGQLQEVMKLFDPNADKVEEGQEEGADQLNNSAETPNNNIEESADMKKERWEEIYDSFKTVEAELNQDGEAVTAVIDQMYRDNKEDPDYQKAYDKWAAGE